MKLGQNVNLRREEDEKLGKIYPEEWEIFCEAFIKAIENDSMNSDIQKLCRKTIKNLKNEGKCKGLSTRDVHIYIRILRRSGKIAYRTTPKTKTIDGLRFGTREEVLNVLNITILKKGLLKKVEEYGFIRGWAIWAKEFNDGKYEKIIPLIFRIRQNVHLALLYLYENKCSSSKSEDVERLFGWKKGTIKAKTPERVERIANKAQILKNIRFKNFLIQELKACQQSGFEFDFQKAMKYAIKKWNKNFGENNDLFLPVSIFGGSKGVSLCSILGVKRTSIDALLDGLQIPQNTWKKYRKK